MNRESGTKNRSGSVVMLHSRRFDGECCAGLAWSWTLNRKTLTQCLSSSVYMLWESGGFMPSASLKPLIPKRFGAPRQFAVAPSSWGGA